MKAIAMCLALCLSACGEEGDEPAIEELETCPDCQPAHEAEAVDEEGRREHDRRRAREWVRGVGTPEPPCVGASC